MPIPDSVLPKEPKSEHRKDIVKQRLATRKVFRACNALLRKQMTCQVACHNCETKCQELQTWLDAENKKEADR
jgi:hypothetical protein